MLVDKILPRKPPICLLCQIKRHVSHQSRIITGSLAAKLKYYQEETQPTSYSLQHYLDLTHDRPALYKLVRTEMPSRLSQVINQLPHYFPAQVYQQRAAQFIQDYFEMTFKEMETLPEDLQTIDPKVESQFLEVLMRAGIRLSGTTEMLSEALIASEVVQDENHLLNIQPSLQKLFHQNLSIDVLVNVYKPKWTKKANSSSCIDPHNNLVESLERAYEDARYLCEQHYINAPELSIQGDTQDVMFPYISSHLYLIFFELFKNSLRATVERYEEGEKLPSITATIDRTDDTIRVTINDQGGGMSEEKLARAKMFFSTSAVLDNMSLYQGAHSSPLAGFGFGLGMVEIFTKYFGGTIYIRSTEGDGTTVKLSFPCQPNMAFENLMCYRTLSE